MESNVRQFAELVAQHEKRLQELENGSKGTSQLNHSSIENGTVHSYDDSGQKRQSIGLHTDGTFAVSYANGPKPPRPTMPETTSRELGIVVAIDGKCVDTTGEVIDPPADIQRFDIYVSETPDFIPSPATTLGPSLIAAGSVFIPADLNPRYVKVLAVTTSTVASDPSDEATAQALPVSSFGVTDQIILEGDGMFIAGDPNGARVQIDEEGIRQFNDESNATISISSSPENSSNYITIHGEKHDTRINWCANPRLSVNDYSWYSGRGNTTRILTDWGTDNTEYVLRTYANSNDQHPFAGYILNTVPVKGSLAVQFEARAGQDCTLYMGLQSITATGASNGIVGSQTFTVADSEIVRVSVIINPPSDTTRLACLVYIDEIALETNEYFDITKCLIEEQSVLLPYFDGDSPNAYWSGAPSNSMSTLVTAPTTIRRNICENPAFLNNTDNWHTFTESASRVPSNGTFESDFMLQANIESYAQALIYYLGTHEFQEGKQYTVSIDVTVSETMALRPDIEWLTDDGTNIHTINGSYTNVAPGQVVRLSIMDIAPTGATQVATFVDINNDDFTATRYVYVSRLLVEQADNVDDYFDGNSTNGTWLGLEGNSESIVVNQADVKNETLASLSNDGSLSTDSLSTQQLTIDGISLDDTIKQLDKSLLSWSKWTGTSPSTTSEIGWVEVAFRSPINRMVHVHFGPFRIRGSGSGMKIRYTTDGTTPTLSSPLLADAQADDGGTFDIDVVDNFGDYKMIRLLVTCVSWLGSSSYLDGGNNNSGSFYAEDAGPIVTSVYRVNDGSQLGTAPPGSNYTYTFQWQSTWTRGFTEDGLKDPTANFVQGWDGTHDNMIMWGFDWRNIQYVLNDINEIIDIQLYVYSWYWEHNNGGIVTPTTNNEESPPTVYSSAYYAGFAEQHMNNPQGKWLQLPKWIGTAFQEGYVKGLNLDARYRGHNTDFHGKFNEQALLKINFTY